MRFVAVCALVLAGCSGEADFSGVLPVETLPAESYRQEILTADRLVFSPGPIGDDGIRALEGVFTKIAKRVGAERKDSKFLKLESLELSRLAIRAANLSPEGTGAPLRNDWMRIRNNLFDDRAWFARSSKDLEAIPPPDPVTVKPVQIALPPPEPARIAPEDVARRVGLEGTWKATAAFANGAPRNDEEILGSTWTFDLPRVSVHDGAGHDTTYNCVVRGDYLVLTPPAGTEGWAKYELRDNHLRIAFFDGLQGRPESFAPRAGSGDPLLVVVELVAVR